MTVPTVLPTTLPLLSLLLLLPALQPASAQSFTIDHTCVVPRYSVSLHEVNVTVETEALLLAEGRCYLSCVESGRATVSYPLSD